MGQGLFYWKVLELSRSLIDIDIIRICPPKKLGVIPWYGSRSVSGTLRGLLSSPLPLPHSFLTPSVATEPPTL